VKREQLQELAQAANFEALRRAVEALCQPFGKPKRICFLPDKHRDEYVCFLERGSTDLNSSIIEDLGGFYFAQGVVFRIPFKQANMNETISARSLGKEAVPSPAN
jgi:hypothetical protein